MQNVHLLKESGVSLSDDLPPKQQKQRKIAVSALKEAKHLGLPAKLKRNGLFLYNKLVSHEELLKEGWAEKYLNLQSDQNCDANARETDGDSDPAEDDDEPSTQSKKRKMSKSSGKSDFHRAGRPPRKAQADAAASALLQTEKSKDAKRRGSRSSERINRSSN
jgi:hypothetical protein